MSPSTKPTVTFSEPVVANTVALSLSRGTTAIAGTTTLSADRKTATFTPSQSLPEDATLLFKVAAGFQDDAGNSGAEGKVSFAMQLSAPPTVTSVTPADQATNVSLQAPISAVFSKDINVATVTVSNFTLAQGGTQVPAMVAYDPATRTATLTPTSGLLENQIYTATLTTGVKDTTGQPLAATKSWSFTMSSDVPTVVSTSPVDQAQNQALNTSVSAVFSEAMDPQTLTSTTFLLKDGSNPIAATVTYDAASKTATLTPSSQLLESRTYTATVTAGAKDISGISLAAAKIWNFTTLATVPTVTNIVPASNATNVAGNAEVKVTFSEAMDPSTFTSATFQILDGSTAIAGTRTWDAPTKTATFTPTGSYAGGATITVQLTTGVKDTSGIALASGVNSSFTVSTAPSVTSSSPNPNASNVALNASVSLTFSMAMDVSTLTSTNVWIEDPQGAKLAATYVPTATTLAMTPNVALAESTLYKVVVTTGVKSATSVAFAANYTFTFTTVGIPPVVSSVTPADLAQDVAISSKVRVVFNEDMTATTFVSPNFRLSDGAADVAGTIATIDARTLEFTPSSPLRERATYTVIADTGLKDKAGNSLTQAFRSSFRTEPLPRVTSVTPAPGALNVPLNSAIIAALNKPVDPATITITPASGTPANTFTLWEGSTRIEGTVSYDASSRTIRIVRTTGGAPALWGAGKRYLVELDGAKLKDLSGNAMGGHLTTTFVAGSAADTTGPSFVTSSPQNGDTGVSRLATPYADFDEPLDQSTVNSTNVQLLDGLTPIAGRIDYAPGLRRVVFVPTAPLPSGKTLTFVLGSGLKDMAGNLRQGLANNISLTTETNAAPTLARMVPPDGATNVPVNMGIRFDFSENINASTLAIELKNGSTAIAGSVRYDAANHSALFRPSANLPLNTLVTVTLKSGLADPEGAATSADVVLSFTTNTGANDLGKPTVSSSSPANGATGVSSRPTITLDFSEPIDTATAATDNFTLQLQGGAKIPFSIRYGLGGDRAFIVPSAPLAAGGIYEVLVGAGVKDLSGNTLDPLAASSKVTFTVDAAPPTISARQPASGSTVGNSVNVQLTFSEDMDPATLDADSFTLSFGGNKQTAAVWYDASSRIAYLQPAVTLPDGVQTVTLDGARVADVAGNKLADSYAFTVSSTGPSVVGTPTPCGSMVDVDNFGNQVVTITFDRAVKLAGGGPLDGSALKLQLGGSDQSVTVTHTAGEAVATFIASGGATPLTAGSTYTVQATTQVVDSATNAPMSSAFSCTFTTQKLIFKDLVNDSSTTGYTVGAAQPAATPNNVWTRLNSVDDGSPPLPAAHNSIVWRAGNATDGQNYVRACAAVNAPDYTVFIEKQVDLTGLTEADLRFDEWHDINDAALDRGRVLVRQGATTTEIHSFGGTAADYQRIGKGQNKLGPYVNSTVTLRFELFIKGYTNITCGGSPAVKRGMFIDNIYVVGK